jgi:hypothetical protein
MKWLSLSFHTYFGLEFAFSDMTIATYAYFWAPFTWKIFFLPFPIKPILFLLVRCVSCRYQVIGYFFFCQNCSLNSGVHIWKEDTLALLIPLINLCLLLRELRPLIFIIIIKKYIVIHLILLFCDVWFILKLHLLSTHVELFILNHIFMVMSNHPLLNGVIF